VSRTDLSWTTVPLDSYRLARYATPLPCCLCGEPNPFDADRCRFCGAPVALTHQLLNQKRPPRTLAVFGPPQCGKTSYLGLLTDIMARRATEVELSTRGAFSVALQQQVITALAEGWFPPATTEDPKRWNWVHGRVTPRRGRPWEFILADIAGSALVREVETPSSQPLVSGLLRKSHGAMILLDGAKLAVGDREPDFFAIKCLHYLSELECRNPNCGHLPVALVLTKVDTCEAARLDPQTWIARLAPAAYQFCRRRLKHWALFACSVAAGVGYQRRGASVVPFPLRVEPYGITEPFDWLMKVLS
jgi:GTPase SAR1 family protein